MDVFVEQNTLYYREKYLLAQTIAGRLTQEFNKTTDLDKKSLTAAILYDLLETSRLEKTTQRCEVLR